MHKLCVLIPTYNHHTALPAIVEKLTSKGLAVFIVNDGSNPTTTEALKKIDQAQVLHLPVNGGKGAAVEAGLQWVSNLGYTHAFQIDADGQHSLDNIHDFIDLSKNNPQALISGNPVYDQSIPLSRKIGRWFTHFWVWVETLSFRIRDSMCGYRVYPVQPSLALLNQKVVGKGMDFDTEIMVRLFWSGTPVLMNPVQVIYPKDNLSNFHAFRDSWRLTKMHTKLFFGMLFNLPRILSRRPKYDSWFSLSERGTILGILTLAASYRLLGRKICTLIAAPVVFYFYLFAPQQRKASKAFMSRVHKMFPHEKPRFTDSLRQFMNFFQMQLDNFAAWGGDMKASQIEYTNEAELTKLMNSGQGGVMLISHLGSMEFSRAMTSDAQKKRLHILLHSKNSQRFNRVMRYFNPQSNVNLMEVTDVGPDTIMYLKDRVDAGDWVVIAADRTPVSENPRVTYVPFLGQEAAFSQGPYIMASILQCPVYTAMAVREGDKYKVSIDLFAEKIILPRGEKQEALRSYVLKYSSLLEKYCEKYKHQWYNFFDFWIDSN